MPEVTIRQLVEAAEKNGFEWATQTNRIHYNAKSKTFTDINIDWKGAILSCVVGQAILNLDGEIFPDPISEYNEYDEYADFDKYRTKSDLAEVFDEIYAYNDNSAKSFEDALEFMKAKLAPYMDERVWI